ncbi:hypothetical protein ACKWTF_016180 [Chironomus riparius]
MLKIFNFFLSFFLCYVECQVTVNEVQFEIKNNLNHFECREDLLNIFIDDSIAHSVFSSWSRFNLNQKYGNSHDFGDFKVCKNIDVDKLSTQYCLVQYFSHTVTFPVPPKKSCYQNIFDDVDKSIFEAVCLPSSCSASDVKDVLRFLNLTNHQIYCKNHINKKSHFFIQNSQSTILKWLNIKRLM